MRFKIVIVAVAFPFLAASNALAEGILQITSSDASIK